METIADRISILELLDRHQIYIDLRDADGYAGLYADDGSYESPFGASKGTHQIKEMFLGLLASGFTAGKRHMTGPVMIDIDRDQANVVSYWWVAETEAAPAVFATGAYHDRLRKIDGRWRIAHRTQIVDPSGSRSK